MDISDAAGAGAAAGGTTVDSALRKNLEGQRERLLAQLSDLEELKEELTAHDEPVSGNKAWLRRPAAAFGDCDYIDGPD